MNEQTAAAIAVEDSTPDDQLSPEARKRKDMRLKRREQRAREKQQKVAQAEAAKAEQYDDIQQLWDFNRARLTEEQRTAMEVRQLEVWDLMECMQDYCDHTLDETGTTQADLDATIQEVVVDVAEHGLCNSSVLVVPRIWNEDQADLRSRFSKPTLDLVTYGYFTAIIERAYQDFFERFLVPRITQAVEESILIRCESPNCTDPGRSIPKRFIDRLKELKMQYLCHNCLVAGQRSAAQASISVFKKAERGGIYDSWGRVKL